MCDIKGKICGFIKNEVLIKNIISHENNADNLEKNLEKDLNLSDEQKALTYKQILIIRFSIMEAVGRGFLLFLSNNCDDRGCQNIKCKYYKNQEQIKKIKFIDMLEHIDNMRFTGFKAWEKEDFKYLKEIRNRVHLSFEKLDSDLEIFNKKLIDKIVDLNDKFIEQCSYSANCINENNVKYCLKELDEDNYEFEKRQKAK